MDEPREYEPMTLERLGALLAGSDDSRRWRLVAEFLEEYRWEPDARRGTLLDSEPADTGDERWDVFLAALAEHLAARDVASSQTYTCSAEQRWRLLTTRVGRLVTSTPCSGRTESSWRKLGPLRVNSVGRSGG